MPSNLSEGHVTEGLYGESLSDLREINFCNTLVGSINVIV